MFYDMVYCQTLVISYYHVPQGKGKPKKSSGESPDSSTDVAILVTVITGEALDKVKDVSDEDIVEQCMGALRTMFPEYVSV